MALTEQVGQADIEIADALLKHARILGKSKDPATRIAAAKAEIELQSRLDALKRDHAEQLQLEAVTAGAR